MKSLSDKSTLLFLGLLIVFCNSCDTKEPVPTVTKPTSVQQKYKQQPAVKTAIEPSTVVARIDGYVITWGELEKRLLTEIAPNPYEYNYEAKPVDAEAVLLKMIAEKAMAMDARSRNFLDDRLIQSSLKRFKEKTLVSLLLKTHLQSKVTVTDSEIDEKVKADPKLTRARAKALLERAKANELSNQFYKQIYEKLHVQKINANFSKVPSIYQQLLRRPKKPRKVRWINEDQVEDELTQEQKNIALAIYDRGQFTVQNWLNALCDVVPPSRSKHLSISGIEKLLDKSLTTPILVSEAVAQGLDKDENFLKQLKEQEDIRLLSKARSEKFNSVKDTATEQEIIAYFNENKENFGTPQTLKINQIWCKDLETARQVKAELANGADFESVKQKYSLRKKDKPSDTYPGYEGIFFEPLWNGEPNEIVGPAKGFYGSDLKWRIVKILEKKPAEPKEYSADMKDTVKMKMLAEKRQTALAEYRKELLEKYPYEIYIETITDIDPLDIP